MTLLVSTTSWAHRGGMNHLPPPSDLPTWRQSLPRLAIRVAIVVTIAWVGLRFYEWVSVQAMTMTGIGGSQVMVGVLFLVLLGYAILIAIPFMPGIEIGAALLLMEGARVAPFVYLATVSGLFLAFIFGRLVSLDWLHRSFRDLRMRRACHMVERIKTQSPADRMEGLITTLPPILATPLISWRYLTIAALLNLPGSVVIGGGGGILMVAGISRLFHAGLTFLTICIGVAPVPLAVWVWGTDLLQ